MIVTLGDAAGIWWVESRDPAEYTIMHRIAPTTKYHVAQNVRSAEVDKP